MIRFECILIEPHNACSARAHVWVIKFMHAYDSLESFSVFKVCIDITLEAMNIYIYIYIIVYLLLKYVPIKCPSSNIESIMI